MKDILIISHFVDFHFEEGNDRFCYIANKLALLGNSVEMITSDYIHSKKCYRNGDNPLILELDYKVTILHEPYYKRNVSLKRIYSHKVFGQNVGRYLKTRKKPDIMYCAVPALDEGKVVAEYAIKNNIRFIIDIQDLWPEAFGMVFDVPLISNFLFYPMKRKADFIYAAADEIIGVSQTYVDRALMVNKKCKEGKSIYLGTNLDYFDSLLELKIDKPKDEIWLAYIGTLGHSYEINMVIDSLSILKERKIDNIKFIIMGDGPLRSLFEGYAKKRKVWTEFVGMLKYEKMVPLLGSCDIAINPIKSGSAGSIINKVGDYAAAGLPVINTQESVEYRNLLEEYQAGFNCKNGDSRDVANKLEKLVEDKDLIKRIGENNRRLAEEKFDRKNTYESILQELL